VIRPDSAAARVTTHPLDAQLEPFRLRSNERIYTVHVERLYARPLYEGILEWSFMEPDEYSDILTEFHCEELEKIEQLGIYLGFMWSGWEPWTLLTPLPDWKDAEFQNPARWQGNLCAATLTSWDSFFPIPYCDGDEQTEEPADYSEASVIYLTRLGEGPLPERIRSTIAWEQVAKPMML
jgi:hypothetical protein